MPKLVVYRYDDQEFRDGQIIASRGDFLEQLNSRLKLAEIAVRGVSAECEVVRRTSLYTWAGRDFAETAWRLSKKQFLYELEVREAHIRHRGNLDHYSAASDLIAAGFSPDDAVRQYWAGGLADARRVEILVSSAKVLRKLQP